MNILGPSKAFKHSFMVERGRGRISTYYFNSYLSNVKHLLPLIVSGHNVQFILTLFSNYFFENVSGILDRMAKKEKKNCKGVLFFSLTSIALFAVIFF